MFRSAHFTLLAAAVLMGCADTPTAGGPTQPGLEANASAQKFWEDNAAVDWNGVARARVAANGFNALQGIRAYAVVGLAQHQAAVAAQHGKTPGSHPSVRAAIGAASVAALTYLFPGDANLLASRLDSVLATPGWPGERHTDPVSGRAIGEAAAAAVVTRAQSDNFFAPFTGTVPVGPGKWFSNNPPTGATIGQAKTFFLQSGAQFRPAPPPAFGSPAFLASLAEVRQISDSRTAEQVALAAFWNLPGGTHTPAGYWNAEAARLAVQYRLRDYESAHLMAIMNMVSYDAVVASHEAKYHYWLLRPSHADPAITLPIGLPNFPSYPSNHSAISAAMARVLAARFPSERARLDALAEQASESRIVGGIHYRFDGDAGLALGRKVAAWGLAKGMAK